MPGSLLLRTRAALTTVACLAGLLAGCGGASNPSNPSGAKATASAGTADQKYSEWEIKFRSCLSDQGFELPKEGKIDFGDRQDAYEAAGNTCTKKIGTAPNASNDEAEMSDNEKEELRLKSDQCLRDQGYEVTDRPGQAPLVKLPDGATAKKGSKECLQK